MNEAIWNVTSMTMFVEDFEGEKIFNAAMFHPEDSHSLAQVGTLAEFLKRIKNNLRLMNCIGKIHVSKNEDGYSIEARQEELSPLTVGITIDIESDIDDPFIVSMEKILNGED